MDSISFFWSFFKMLAALAVVIALMIVAMYFMKKYFFHSLPDANGSALINIISTRHLSPKHSIMLVEVLGQVILLGVSNQQMSMLSAITDPDAREKIKIARLKDGLLSAADPLSQYRSLFRNFVRLRKDR
ncbi:MAG: flagellar biosynthetic protein FliO [Pseudomonadota bacterium]